MNANKNEWKHLDTYLTEFKTITKSFIDNLDERNVASPVTTIESNYFPEHGHTFLETIETLKQTIIPNLSASRGGRYWGFVTGGATPISTFADWLVTTFDQNVSKDGDSITTAIEHQTIAWICSLFHLPNSFKGSVTTGATAANVLAAITSRQYVGNQQNIDIAKEGMAHVDVDIFSACPHASMLKALGIAGFGQNQVKKIKTLPNSEKMDVDDLVYALSRSNAKSKIVISSAGTVTATDFDSFPEIKSICRTHNAWLHVDAAFGIFDRLVNGPNGKTKGIEFADSITLDCHKWLNVPYESGIFLTQHPEMLFSSCDVPAPYLTATENQIDFMSFGIENSRRFRAFPIWLTLYAYGREGIKTWVSGNMECALTFSKWIKDHKHLELMISPKLNVVLFRTSFPNLSETEQDEKTKALLLEINRSGKLFLSPGKWDGKNIIRAAISNWQTDDEDVLIATKAIDIALGKIMM